MRFLTAQGHQHDLWPWLGVAVVHIQRHTKQGFRQATYVQIFDFKFDEMNAGVYDPALQQ